MEPVWNGHLTCDYERTRPGSTALELDLYTTSLTRWPTVLMNDPRPYGQLRRAGIVDIPEPDHRTLTESWHRQLGDPDYAAAMVAAARQRRQHTDTALDSLEHALRVAGGKTGTCLARATTAFLDVMSTHIVNWLLPEQQWEDLLTDLLGGRHQGRACLLVLNTPDAAGHLLDAHQFLLSNAAAVRDGTDLAAAATAVSARTGTLYGHGSPAAAAMPLEDRTAVAELIVTTARTDTDGQLQAIGDARHRATVLRDAWALAALLAAAGDTAATRQVTALTAVCRWAADSEESRKIQRHRYLAAARRCCERADIDPTAVTTADLLHLGAAR
ncbi:hypothetical protein [Kitasatospora sp. NPDC059817]|uniref:hypothetical protein n=1 Tax=Kitasatospora sp. NPDC059817 TaxID=3346961 RepID=UPI0036518248